MTKSKSKLVISMLVLLFVLLSSIAIVVIAFALTQQTITTTLTITYKAEDLEGSVYATYKIGDTESFLTPVVNGGEIGEVVGTQGQSLVFRANNTTGAGSLKFPEGLSLDSTNDSILIKYTYTNLGSKHYIASMSFDSKMSIENMNIEYGIMQNGEIVYSSNRYALVLPGITEENPTSTRSYWIRISIDKKAKSASFSGAFQWDLVGCNQDKTSEDYLSLTSLTFTGEAGSYSASISSTGDYTGTIVFPSKVGTDSVTKIVQNSSVTYAQKEDVRNVVIPDSVTEIGSSAFADYPNLQTVTFEQNATTSSASVQSSTGLQTIGNYAFGGCSNLKDFNIPSSVTTIESYAFSGCTSLTKIVIPKGVTELASLATYAWSGCTGIVSITVEEGSPIFTAKGNCLIYNKTLIMACKKSVIPDDGSVTTIGTYVGVKDTYTIGFITCPEHLVIPEGVTSISDSQIHDSTGKTITIPKSLRSIEYCLGSFARAIVIDPTGWTNSNCDLSAEEIEAKMSNPETAAELFSTEYTYWQHTPSNS